MERELVTHNKLVRDLIPEWIISRGDEANYRIVEDPEEMGKLLRAKLLEETLEAIDAKEGELLGELGDVLSAVIGLAKYHGISYCALLTAQQKKDREKGVFDNGIFLISATKEGYG